MNANEPQPSVQLIHGALWNQVLEDARKSLRRRKNYNFHTSMEDNPHRFLNVMLRDTYITPHRHLYPPKAESFLVLEGRIAFFILDDAGELVRTDILDATDAAFARGIDIAPGIWHTMIVLSEHAVCFEVKPGPYQPSDDKEFADWAPLETELYTRIRKSDPPADHEARCRAYRNDLLNRASVFAQANVDPGRKP